MQLKVFGCFSVDLLEEIQPLLMPVLEFNQSLSLKTLAPAGDSGSESPVNRSISARVFGRWPDNTRYRR
jgi:hypothetical protein